MAWNGKRNNTQRNERMDNNKKAFNIHNPRLSLEAASPYGSDLSLFFFCVLKMLADWYRKPEHIEHSSEKI